MSNAEHEKRSKTCRSKALLCAGYYGEVSSGWPVTCGRPRHIFARNRGRHLLHAGGLEGNLLELLEKLVALPGGFEERLPGLVGVEERHPVSQHLKEQVAGNGAMQRYGVARVQSFLRGDWKRAFK